MEQPVLNERAYYFLADIRKWSKFISIIGFVFIGFMILMGIIFYFVIDALMENIPNYPISGSLYLIIFLVSALIYFFPVLYLYKFSVNLGNALQSGYDTSLSEAFRYLKSHYNFIGILIIVVLALYALAFVVAIFAGMFGFLAM